MASTQSLRHATTVREREEEEEEEEEDGTGHAGTVLPLRILG